MTRARWALLLIVGSLAMLWRLGPGAGEPEPVRITLAEVEGTVVLSSAERGARRVQAGADVAVGDAVKASDNGRAVLTTEAGSSFSIEGGTSLVVTSIGAAEVGIALREGSLRATVRPDAQALVVDVAGRTVRADDASFAAAVRAGVAEVQVDAGSVALDGPDGQELGSGERAVFDASGDLSVAAMEELLLAVDFEPSPPTRAERVPVEGRTAPFALVVVDGAFGRTTTRADPDGIFSLMVPLLEGDNHVEVRASLPLGDSVSASGDLPERDTTPPRVRARVEYAP